MMERKRQVKVAKVKREMFFGMDPMKATVGGRGEEHDVKEKKQECMHAQTRSNPAMSGSIR